MAEKKDHSTSGGLIAGTGGTVAAGGLVGGGIPGFKSKSSTIDDAMKYSKTGEKNSWRRRTGAALSTGRGGIFGYRTDAHVGAKRRFRDSDLYFKDKPAKRGEMYSRGNNAGRIAPEEKIIRHMKLGRRLSGAALVGGTAATAYGVHRAKSGEVKKGEQHTKQYNATLLGAGGTAAAASLGGEKLFERQGNKWGRRAQSDINAAQKIVPNLGGVAVNKYPDKVPNPKVPDIGRAGPGDTLIRNSKKILAGKSKVQAHAAGRLHGDAAQARYFAGVYGSSAKTARRLRTPAMAAVGAGTAGLLAARDGHDKDKVKKRNMSDAEIRRRKKVQGHVSQVTGALGLAALGGTLAASRGGRGTLRRIPQLRSKIAEPKPLKPDRDRIKGAVTPVLATSAGLGGIGAFNFASYTGAESKKRRQPVSKGVAMEMGYNGEVGHPLLPTEIEAEVEKAWTPVASNFDSENSRHKRSKVYERGALVGAGAAGAYGGHQAVQGVRAARGIKSQEMAPMTEKVTQKAHTRKSTGGKVSQIAAKTTKVADMDRAEKVIGTKAIKGVLGHGGKAAAGAGAAGALIGGSVAIKRKRQGSWQSYGKRYDEVSKLDRKEKGALWGAGGGLFGPVGSGVASTALAPQGKRLKHGAIGTGAGMFGPVGGGAAGYYAAKQPRPRPKKKVAKNLSPFGVEH